ncbi:MAG: hypothetical protein GF375_04895 [Candidatus Omnitrophica bacterium]|nr:hypothetical protein [Candidatus Omnitrophota bacterium]
MRALILPFFDNLKGDAMNRKLFRRSIGAFGKFIQYLKWELKHFKKTWTKAETKEAKAEIKECQRQYDEAISKLHGGDFTNPLDEHIAKARAERIRVTNMLKRKAQERKEAEREAKDKEAQKAYREKVEEARKKGKPVPPKRGRKQSALDFLAK